MKKIQDNDKKFFENQNKGKFEEDKKHTEGQSMVKKKIL